MNSFLHSPFCFLDCHIHLQLGKRQYRQTHFKLFKFGSVVMRPILLFKFCHFTKIGLISQSTINEKVFRKYKKSQNKTN